MKTVIFNDDFRIQVIRKMKVFHLTLTLLLGMNLSHGQIISSPTKRIVSKIEKYNVVECAYVGYEGSPSKQYGNFQELFRTASDQELIDLTNHRNGSVRSYAFQALAHKNIEKVFPILLKHLNDTAALETQCGCIGGTQYVGDYFVDVVAPNFIMGGKYHLTNVERQKLDSILIFQDGIRLAAKSRLLRHLEPEPKYYQRIRYISISESTQSLHSL